MARTISQKEYDKRAEALVQKVQDEVSVFDDPSEEAKQERKRRSEEDLLYFCKTYFPHHFEEEFEQGHEKMAESLKHKKEIIQWMGFRGVGKTTLAFVGYGLQAILFKKTHYLPVIADNDDLAELLMMPMKVELENNPRIAHDFGDQKGYPWKQDNLVTSGNVKLEANSWKSFKRGRKHMQYRPEIIIGDDWESKESAKNPANSEKREETLMGDVFNAMDLKKDYQLLMVTNKLGRKCLATRLKENEGVLTVEVPAREEGKLNGAPVHPKSFPDEVLDDILKKIGMVAFAREYLLKIVSSEDDDFQEDWFFWIKKPVDGRLFRVSACDPSVGSTEGHDTKAIITVDLIMSEDIPHFDVVHAWIRHTTISKMCKALFDINTQLQPNEMVIESNGFQELIKDKLKNMAVTGKQKDLLTKIFQMQNNVFKNTRIMRLQTPIENEDNAMRFVEGAGDMNTLQNQLLDFRSDRTDNTDDGPDALEMAHRRLRQKAGMASNEVEAQVL